MHAGMAAGRQMAAGAANDAVAVGLRKLDLNEHLENWWDLNRRHEHGEVLSAEDAKWLEFHNKFWQSRPGWPADDIYEQEVFIEGFFDGLNQAH
jgi:hypothetical protein